MAPRAFIFSKKRNVADSCGKLGTSESESDVTSSTERLSRAALRKTQGIMEINGEGRTNGALIVIYHETCKSIDSKQKKALKDRIRVCMDCMYNTKAIRQST